MKRRSVLCLTAGVGSLTAGCLSDIVGWDDDRLNARGEIDVVVDGEPVDLAADRFQSEHAADDAAAFHLHEGHEGWFMEGTEPVTIAEGLDLLPRFAFETREGAAVVTVDGRSYDDRESGTTISFRVDGGSVDPTTYELEDGDAIELEVVTDGE